MTRIDGLNPLATGRTMAGQASSAIEGNDNDRSANGVAAGRQDVLAVSARGRIVATAAHEVSSASDVRAEKVAALKAAIAGGTYTSNARAIAQRLLANGLGSD